MPAPIHTDDERKRANNGGAATTRTATPTTSMPERSGEVQVGSQRLRWGSQLLPMADSTRLYCEGRVAECTALLQRDGYLLLRGVIPPLRVLRARECLCEALHDEWHSIDVESAEARAEAPPAAMLETDRAAAANDPAAAMSEEAVARLFASTPLLRARIKPVAASGQSAAASSVRLHSGLLLTGYRPVTHDPRVLDVLEGPQLARLFAQLFGQLEADNATAGPASPLHSPASTSASSSSVAAPAIRECVRPPAVASPSTFDTKWVRVMSVGDLTEEHTDYYRFEHFAETATGSDASASASADTEDGARHMFTCWLPLGHYTSAHGTLAVAEGSHRLSGYKRGVFGSSECKDELPPDFARWLDGDAATCGGVWRTADFAPGDVVVFDIRLVHASTANTRPHFRLSMDTRWKPTALVLDEQREAFRALPVPHVDDSQAP